MTKTLPRRTLLIRALQLPALGWLLGGSAAIAADAPGCNNGDLSAADKQKRAAQHYTDTSPHDHQKDCSNCSLFQSADQAGQCGSCLILPGPIHPYGYCDAWTNLS